MESQKSSIYHYGYDLQLRTSVQDWSEWSSAVGGKIYQPFSPLLRASENLPQL